MIALQTSTLDDANDLRELILTNWPAMAALYRGSGAPYLRVAQLARLLQDLNVKLDFVADTVQLRIALEQEIV